MFISSPVISFSLLTPHVSLTHHSFDAPEAFHSSTIRDVERAKPVETEASSEETPEKLGEEARMESTFSPGGKIEALLRSRQLIKERKRGGRKGMPKKSKAGVDGGAAAAATVVVDMGEH